MCFISFQSKFWGNRKDSTTVRMREMKRLKQPPVRAGPICCRVVVDRVPNSRWASTSQAATPIPCPTNAAASDTSMHQTHTLYTDTCIRQAASDTCMHQTHQCIRHIRHMHQTQTHASDTCIRFAASDTCMHQTHQCIKPISASDTCIGHRHMHQTCCIRHMHASDTCIRLQL